MLGAEEGFEPTSVCGARNLCVAVRNFKFRPRHFLQLALSATGGASAHRPFAVPEIYALLFATLNFDRGTFFGSLYPPPAALRLINLREPAGRWTENAISQS